ncbi:hypothetical protein JMJ35_007041 [Cladonia borealis]|uniref:C2H2-type domain-containing protein n=1 Tax=Cladonia borealis TaxID=184061 RepID=A0AA39QYE5_9LECA|nr:hypothetical protein JMJ35_007041 [Cladonia borealis]
MASYVLLKSSVAWTCESEGCERRFSAVSDLRPHRKTHKANARSPNSANTWNFDRSAYPPDLEDTDTGNLNSIKINPDRKSPHSETDYFAAFLDSGSAAIEMNSGAECESTMLEQSRLHTDWEQPEIYTTRSDFWTSRITRSRRDSVDSLSSSMNSSLHGKATFDPQEQKPAFRDSHSHSSVDFGDSSRGLPPPPVEIGKKHSFECDICGDTIRVDRRREWQEHVLEDLRPYTCTVENCGVADHVYASRAAFSQHEALDHPHMADLDPRCSFCSEDIGLDRSNRERHIGRHMEEIAFAVVTKPYEEWDFYSGPSEKHLDGPSLNIAGVALLGAFTSYNLALAGQQGSSSLQPRNAAASFLPRDVFAFVKGGTGAIRASPLDPFARFIKRILFMGTDSRKHHQEGLAVGGWWGTGNAFGFVFSEVEGC